MFEIYHDIFAVVTECTGPMYGQNCNLSCGHCIMSEQCHHINGTCMSGCDIGYHGLHCTEGKHQSNNSNTVVFFWFWKSIHIFSNCQSLQYKKANILLTCAALLTQYKSNLYNIQQYF